MASSDFNPVEIIQWMFSNPIICVISGTNTSIGPAPRHTFGWDTCRACLSLPAKAGLVETYLHCAMALLTLHRLPSISTAPVSSDGHPLLALLCTNKLDMWHHIHSYEIVYLLFDEEWFRPRRAVYVWLSVFCMKSSHPWLWTSSLHLPEW